MSSWLAGKVSDLVKDAQRVVSPNQCTADDLAAELTQQARSVSSIDGALDLILRWNEQIGSSAARFPLRAESGGNSNGAAGNYLSFHLVLLRSQAFETLLDTCGKAPAISAALRVADADKMPLGRALFNLAEKVFLQGSMRLWSTLLEALLDGDEVGVRAGPKWRPWARHVLTSMKRRWESEALTVATKQLDRQLGELAAASSMAMQESSANAELQRQGAEGMLSKRGIRAALARGKLRQCTAESDSWRRRTGLLSEICERLLAMEGCADASVPNLERLVSDADTAIGTLDSGKEQMGADQETLGRDLSELGSALEKQITGVLLTQEAFLKKRTGLNEEREALMRQVYEIDSQLELLEEETSRCKAQIMHLRGQFESMTKHYDSKKVGNLNSQRSVADRKIRAFSFRAMSEEALSVARADAKRYDAELRVELRRRKAELKKTCLSYINSERSRLHTATECLDDSRMVGQTGASVADVESSKDIGDELAELMSMTQGAWRSAQAVLKRVEPLVDGFEVAGGSSGTDCRRNCEQPVEVNAEDAREFFNSEAVVSQGCVDCNTPVAEWASVSCGVYLCMDCAGRHRSLGVHLSFVRSIKMDRWSVEQLQRMKLGGNARFHEFLKGYPALSSEAISSTQAHRKCYGSRAVAYYRHCLESECLGIDSSLEKPLPEEGHLPVEAWPAHAGLPDARGSGGTETSPRRPDSARSAGEADKSLEEARATLESVYLELQCRLRDALVPE